MYMFIFVLYKAYMYMYVLVYGLMCNVLHCIVCVCVCVCVCVVPYFHTESRWLHGLGPFKLSDVYPTT